MSDPPIIKPGDPSMAGRTVSVLMVRAVAGDRASCAALVARVDPLLQLYARRQLAPPFDPHHDTGDVVNEAWSRILPRLAEIQPNDGRMTRALLKYAATVIKNLVCDLARARHHAWPGGRSASESTSNWVQNEYAIDQSGVVSVVARREALARLHDAIDGLRARDREIVLLRGIGQQSNEEVAAQLDLSPGAIAVRYHRALDRLRKLLPMSAFDDLFAEDA